MVRRTGLSDETGESATTTTTAPASEVPAPATLNDGLPLPKLFVFDLDYTLWPFWVDTHVTGPLKATKDGLVVKDRYGEGYGFYSQVAGILVALKDRDIAIGAASRTSAPELAREMLSYLRVPVSSSSSSSATAAAAAAAANPKAIAQFDHLEIYPGSKMTHFNRLHRGAGLPFEEMVFFDDERRNREVEKLGVVMQLVRDGVTRDEIDEGVRKWRVRHNRTEKED